MADDAAIMPLESTPGQSKRSSIYLSRSYREVLRSLGHARTLASDSHHIRILKDAAADVTELLREVESKEN